MNVHKLLMGVMLFTSIRPNFKTLGRMFSMKVRRVHNLHKFVHLHWFQPNILIFLDTSMLLINK